MGPQKPYSLSSICALKVKGQGHMLTFIRLTEPFSFLFFLVFQSYLFSFITPVKFSNQIKSNQIINFIIRRQNATKYNS